MVNFRINADLWENFTTLARGRGMTSSDLLRDLILQELEGVSTNVDTNVKEEILLLIAENHREIHENFNSLLEKFYGVEARLQHAENELETALNKIAAFESATADTDTATTTDITTTTDTDTTTTDTDTITTDTDPIDMLGLRAIADGLRYNQALLHDRGTYHTIADNRYLLIREGIKYRAESIGMIRDILEHFGYQIKSVQSAGIRLKQAYRADNKK